MAHVPATKDRRTEEKSSHKTRSNTIATVKTQKVIRTFGIEPGMIGIETAGGLADDHGQSEMCLHGNQVQSIGPRAENSLCESDAHGTDSLSLKHVAIYGR